MSESVDESIFDKYSNRWHNFNKLYHEIIEDKVGTSNLYLEHQQSEPLKILFELDLLKKKFRILHSMVLSHQSVSRPKEALFHREHHTWLISHLKLKSFAFQQLLMRNITIFVILAV